MCFDHQIFSILCCVEAIIELLEFKRRYELMLDHEEVIYLKEALNLFSIFSQCLKILQSEGEILSNMVIPFFKEAIDS